MTRRQSEPLSVTGIEAYLAKSVLTAAIRVVKGHLEAAQEAERETAQRCVERLNAAHAAAKGLEDEYREILRDVSHFDLADPAARKQLLARINRYLRDENLRPLLVRAKDGLQASEKALRANAEAFLGVPRLGRLLNTLGVRSRQEVVERLSVRLTDLVAYLENLDRDFDRRPYSEPSGVGLDDLLKIEEDLKRPDVSIGGGEREEVKQRAATMLETHDQSKLVRDAGEVEALTEELLIAFR
jgi:hypothetical protein